MERLPPIQDSLQHTKRAMYKAGIWCTSELCEQLKGNPKDWGWTLNEEKNWIPV